MHTTLGNIPLSVLLLSLDSSPMKIEQAPPDISCFMDEMNARVIDMSILTCFAD